MKTVKKTVSLQADVWEYVASEAKDNASAFINKVIRAHRRQQLENALIKGYQEMSCDGQFAKDLSLWDTTLLDGLTDEDSPSR